MTSTAVLFRERAVILAMLLLLATAAWGVLINQSAGMVGGPMTELTMGMGALLFLAIWVVMMVAMMFPTAAPMIMMFHRIHTEHRRRGRAFVPTWIFVGAYLVIWIGAGALAYVGATGAQTLAAMKPEILAHAAQLGGVVLILAGLYQLSPLKTRCLTKCRSPLAFLLGSWRDGARGAVRMGLEHGVYCLGCCWLLFVILFPLGMMNVAAMAIITALIFAEKALPLGRRIGQVAAVALLAYGSVVVAVPAALPTFVSDMTYATTPMLESPAPADKPGPPMPGGSMPGM
jgi:predicted metal-binding membrane protein